MFVFGETTNTALGFGFITSRSLHMQASYTTFLNGINLITKNYFSVSNEITNFHLFVTSSVFNNKSIQNRAEFKC